MIRIIVADDHDIVRSGLKSIISKFEDMEVVGESGSGKDTVSQCVEHKPDVLLLDLDMPDLGGLDILDLLKTTCPDTRILILTMHDNTEYAIRAMKSGARGYILKGSPPGELPKAIREVHNNRKYIAEPLKEKILFRSLENISDDPIESLSTRELQVLTRLCLGKKLADVATELDLSINTIGTYKRRIRDKLGVDNDEEMFLFARNHNLV